MSNRKSNMIAILFATIAATAVFLSLISSAPRADPPDIPPEVVIMQDWPEVRPDATKRAYIIPRYPRDGDLSILESLCYDPLLGPSALIHNSLCDGEVTVTSNRSRPMVVILTGTPNPTDTPLTGTPNTPTPTDTPTTTPPPTITDTPTPIVTTPPPKCNRGLGNGAEGCDPGNSGGKPGNAGEEHEPNGPPGKNK